MNKQANTVSWTEKLLNNYIYHLPSRRWHKTSSASLSVGCTEWQSFKDHSKERRQKGWLYNGETDKTWPYRMVTTTGTINTSYGKSCMFPQYKVRIFTSGSSSPKCITLFSSWQKYQTNLIEGHALKYLVSTLQNLKFIKKKKVKWKERKPWEAITIKRSLRRQDEWV
jgi:hypothetical protein